MYALYHALCSHLYYFTMGMLSGTSYPTGKQTRTGAGMGKNLYLHTGMGFLSGRVRVGGCGYVTTLPDRFLPVSISNADAHKPYPYEHL
jgi:hypothetical protein